MQLARAGRGVERPTGVRAEPATGPEEDPVDEQACGIVAVLPGREIALSGRLDVTAAADVRLALVAAVAAGTGELVVDLSALELIDVTGLGMLVGIHRAAGRQGRTLVLRDVPPQVGRLLFLTRLDRVLRTTRTRRPPEQGPRPPSPRTARS